MDNPAAEEDEPLRKTMPKDLPLSNLEEKIKIEPPEESDDELFSNALQGGGAVEKEETRDSDDNEQSIKTAALTWHQTKAISEDVKRRTTQDYFSYQESLSIYTFLLDEIRSHNPERLGRVAKRRVETGDGRLWARFKRDYCGRREVGAYRGHFRAVSTKLHEFQGLSELEKLDLFYALDIKVPKTIRSHLVDLYKVEFNKDGIIIGSPQMAHWDLVHPDTDREDEPEIVPKKGKVKWLRFSEREDGVMWQYLLDFVLKKEDCTMLISRKFWEEFKNEYEGEEDAWKRVPETYRGRYTKFLAPNLHRMPFDVETKAVLYLKLKIPVDRGYREELIRSTGVKIDANGHVIEYENMPENFVLQSRHYESVIGISSANRVSILRNPHTSEEDLVPYTLEEDQQIWDFIKTRLRNPRGKAVRIRQKLTGTTLWREFRAAVRTRRFTRSLNQHFNEDMIPSIMQTDFDFITKLELLFSLDVTLEDDDLKIIKENTKVLHLNRKGAIRYVAGDGFCIGKNKEKPVRVSKRALQAQAIEEMQKNELLFAKMESFSDDDSSFEQRYIETLISKATESNNEMPSGFLRNFKQRPQLVQNDLTQPITIFPYMPYQKWVKRAQQRRIGPQNKRGRKRKYPLPEDKECSSLYASAASTSSCSTQLESPPSFNEKKPESLLFNETTPTTIKRVKVLAPTLASRQSSRVSKPTTRMAEFRNLGLETTNDDSSFPKEEKPTSLLHDVQPSEHSSSSATPRFFASGQVVRAGPATPRVGIPVARQVGRSGRFLTSGLPMSLRQAPVVARVSGTGARAGITTSLKPMSIRFQTLGLNTRLIKVRRPDQVPVSLRTLGTTAQPTKTIRYMISNKGPASTAELSTSTESRDSTLPDKEVKKEYSTASIPCEEKPELLDDTLPGQLETAGASGPNAAQFSVSTMESTPPKRQTVPYLSNESILRDLGPSAAPLIDSVLRQRTELRREREQQKKAADFPLSGSTEIPTTACAQIKHDNPNSSPQNQDEERSATHLVEEAFEEIEDEILKFTRELGKSKESIEPNTLEIMFKRGEDMVKNFRANVKEVLLQKQTIAASEAQEID